MGAVILSLCYHLNKVGAAFYDENSATVSVFRDVFDDFQYRIVRSLLEEVEPTVTIVSKSQDVALLGFLRELSAQEAVTHKQRSADGEHAEDGQANEEEENENDMDDREETEESGREEDFDSGNDPNNEVQFSFALHLMPKIAYDLSGAKTRISVLFEAAELNAEENFLKLALHVDMTAVNMVRAFGALLKYLDAVRLGVEFEEYSVKTPVRSIKTFTVDEAVEMDTATFEALQIFQREKPRSTFKAFRAHGSKEGPCLFRICDQCKSKSGKALLKRWFERPTVNRKTLLARQTAISFFLQDCNAESAEFIFTRVKRMVMLKGIMKRAKGGRLSVNDWRNLYIVCTNSVQIVEHVKMRGLHINEYVDELQEYSKDLACLSAIILEIIDFRESNSENRFVVNEGVDSELDRLKNVYAGLPKTLTEVAREESRRLNIGTCSVGYVPMFGYLLALPNDVDVSCTVGNDLQLVYEIQEESVKHMKNARMRELDEQVGDIKMEILDLETSVMLRLQTMVCEHARSVLRAVHICASIECCISLALTAREYNWRRPTLVDESVIDVDKGRHPIAELLSPSKFIANPIRSGGAQTKVKLLVGPNASGKSVYLKQVGIIAFLAHVGSFVPAERAIIGPINRIMTRMYTIDSVLDGMSSFATDVAQMAVSLHRGTAQSLIIIDEFGKGTLTEVGLSLLASSLNYWIDRGADSCPHVFVSSHFHSLVNVLHRDPTLLSYHTLEVSENNGKLEFEYQLVDGIIDCSYAVYTAEVMGIPKTVIRRGIDFYEFLKSGVSIETMSLDNSEAELMAKVEPLVDAFLEWDVDNGCEASVSLSCGNAKKAEILANPTEGKERPEDDISEMEGVDGELASKRSGNEPTSHLLRATLSSRVVQNLSTTVAEPVPDGRSFGNLTVSSILKYSSDRQPQQSRNVSFMSPVANYSDVKHQCS